MFDSLSGTVWVVIPAILSAVFEVAQWTRNGQLLMLMPPTNRGGSGGAILKRNGSWREQLGDERKGSCLFCQHRLVGSARIAPRRSAVFMIAYANRARFRRSLRYGWRQL